MKKMKWAVMFAAAMAMMGFTSCLDNDNDVNTITGCEYMRVSGISGYYRFTSMLNYTVTPNNQSNLMSSDLTSGGFALVIYQYSPDSIQQNSTNIPATVGATSVIEGTYNDNIQTGFANAPFAQVDIYPYALPYYSKNDLFLTPASYYKGSTTDYADLLNRSYMLTYGNEEGKVSQTELILTLHQRVPDLSVNDERSQRLAPYVHFDISRALSQYTADTGQETPDYVVIQYKVPENLSNLEEALNYENAETTTSPLRIPYKSYIEQYFSTNN